MLDARFSHLHFCQSLPTPQRGLSAIADLLVLILSIHRAQQPRCGWTSNVSLFGRRQWRQSLPYVGGYEQKAPSLESASNYNCNHGTELDVAV